MGNNQSHPCANIWCPPHRVRGRPRERHYYQDYQDGQLTGSSPNRSSRRGSPTRGSPRSPERGYYYSRPVGSYGYYIRTPSNSPHRSPRSPRHRRTSPRSRQSSPGQRIAPKQSSSDRSMVELTGGVPPKTVRREGDPEPPDTDLGDRMRMGTGNAGPAMTFAPRDMEDEEERYYDAKQFAEPTWPAIKHGTPMVSRVPSSRQRSFTGGPAIRARSKTSRASKITNIGIEDDFTFPHDVGRTHIGTTIRPSGSNLSGRQYGVYPTTKSGGSLGAYPTGFAGAPGGGWYNQDVDIGYNYCPSDITEENELWEKESLTTRVRPTDGHISATTLKSLMKEELEKALDDGSPQISPEGSAGSMKTSKSSPSNNSGGSAASGQGGSAGPASPEAADGSKPGYTRSHSGTLSVGSQGSGGSGGSKGPKPKPKPKPRRSGDSQDNQSTTSSIDKRISPAPSQASGASGNASEKSAAGSAKGSVAGSVAGSVKSAEGSVKSAAGSVKSAVESIEGSAAGSVRSAAGSVKSAAGSVKSAAEGSVRSAEGSVRASASGSAVGSSPASIAGSVAGGSVAGSNASAGSYAPSNKTGSATVLSGDNASDI